MTDCNHIHYKSDFDFVLSLKDCTGAPLLWPRCDFRAEFFTSVRGRFFVVSCIGGEATNCRRDEDGRIHVYADNHGLPAGRLSCEFTLYIPDESYPDGVHRVVFERMTDVLLDKTGCKDCVISEIELQLPVFVRDLQEFEHNIGAAIDKVNAELEAILGREPVNRPAKVSCAPVPERLVLRRGDIPAFAAVGNAYQIQRNGDGEFVVYISFKAGHRTINYGRLFPERESDHARIVRINYYEEKEVEINTEAKTATLLGDFNGEEGISIYFCYDGADANMEYVATAGTDGALRLVEATMAETSVIAPPKLNSNSDAEEFWAQVKAQKLQVERWASYYAKPSPSGRHADSWALGEEPRPQIGRFRRWKRLNYLDKEFDKLTAGLIRCRIKTKKRCSAWVYYVRRRSSGKGGYYYKRIEK